MNLGRVGYNAYRKNMIFTSTTSLNIAYRENCFEISLVLIYFVSINLYAETFDHFPWTVFCFNSQLEMGDIKKNIAKMKKKLSAEAIKRQKLRNSQLFVLDNSLRESTVGQLRGHTLENKWKIYEEVGTALNGDHEGVQ